MSWQVGCKWRQSHVLPFWSKIMVCGNRSHEYSFENMADWFSLKHAHWRWLSKCCHGFFYFEEIEPKFYKIFILNFQKSRYVRKSTYRWICVQNFNAISWKRPGFAVLSVKWAYWVSIVLTGVSTFFSDSHILCPRRVKRPVFAPLTGISTFLSFFTSCSIYAFKKCFCLLFAFLTKIWS